MEVKQYTKVLVWDLNKCPKYRGFLYMEVKQYTKVLVWDLNKCPKYRGFLYMEVLIRQVSLYIATASSNPACIIIFLCETTVKCFLDDND